MDDNTTKLFVGYETSSVFSDESALASDIEADLQELPVQIGGTETDITSFVGSSVSSLISPPFMGSLSSLLTNASASLSLTGDDTPKESQQHYLRTVFLNITHTHLGNPQLRENCGSPTCISVQSFLAIGTNKGFIFVFDRRQKLRLCIDTSSTKLGPGHGAITSLSQNLSGTRLISGFASGCIAMWKLPKGDVIEEDAKMEQYFQSGMGDVKVKNQRVCNLLRIIDDAHQECQSIVVCAFTSLITVAVSVDSSGSAYEMDFKRGMLGRSTLSACFFSGSHGEISALSPLLPIYTNDFLDNHRKQPAFRALLGSAMVVMASFTKVIVVALKPKFRVIFWQHLKGPPSCLPFLAWSWCLSEASTSQPEETSAFLGFARASTLHVARITTRLLSTPVDVQPSSCVFNLGGRSFIHQFQLLRSILLNQSIVAIHLFTPDYFAILDSEEIFRLYDLSTEKEVESCNLTNIKICYGSSAFQCPTSGATVSEALACASEHACANAISSVSGKLFILGKNSIPMLVFKSWKERAISLFTAGRIEEALNTCQHVLEERPVTADLRDSLLNVLTHMPLAHPKRRLTLPVASSLVETCIRGDLMEFFQTSVIPAYRRDPLAFPLFLRCLCSRLLQLKPIYLVADNSEEENCCLRHLSPDIGVEMLTWCVYGPNVALPAASSSSVSLTSESLPDRKASSSTQHFLVENGRPLAESCLVRFSTTSLDIDKVLKFCLSSGLYQGFIYVYTYVLNDHEAAFRWLTDLLIKKTQSFVENRDSLDNISSLSVHSTASSEPLENLKTSEAINAILLFLRSCFAGEEIFGVPFGPKFLADIPNKVSGLLEMQIFNLLLSSRTSSPERRSTSLFAQQTASPNFALPRLRILLHFGGAVDLLNMLTLALRESPFFSPQQCSLDLCCQRRQRLFNALVTCALDEAGEALAPVGSEDIKRVLCFIGEQILLAENAPLVFDNQKIILMLEYLSKRIGFCGGTDLPLSDLSDIMYRLLSSGRLPASPNLLKVAEQIGLNDFCELVYRRQGNLVAVLSCLLTNLQRTVSIQKLRNTLQLQDLVSRIFVFLSDCLASSADSDSSVMPLVNGFLEHVELYARLDPIRCLLLLVKIVGPSMRRILHVLDTVFMGDELLPHLLLHGVSSQTSQLSFYEDISITVERPHHPAAVLILQPFYEILHSEMPELERENVVATVAGDTTLREEVDALLAKPDPLVAELYVHLLLIGGRRKDVCEFLMLNVEYRASVLIEMLDEETYQEELACVYEKIGDRDKAADLLKKDFLAHWQRLITCSSTASTATDSGWCEDCARVRSRAEAWMSFAARHSSSERSSANEPPWFAIIDTFSGLRNQQSSNQLTAELNHIFHQLLEAASPYVPIPALINRVLQVSDASVASFGSATNRFLLQLVGVWHKEVSLLQDCYRLMTSDITESERILVEALKRGVGLGRYSCGLCGLTFARRYRKVRSLITCRLHTGGFSTLDERQATRPEILLFWCGHGVHLDCYENYRDLHENRLPEGKQFVCLRCASISDPSSTPLPSNLDGGTTTQLLSTAPSHLLDAYDEIQVGDLRVGCPSQIRAQKTLQELTNPFGEEEDN